jgi:hypothetical protein
MPLAGCLISEKRVVAGAHMKSRSTRRRELEQMLRTKEGLAEFVTLWEKYWNHDPPDRATFRQQIEDVLNHEYPEHIGPPFLN